MWYHGKKMLAETQPWGLGKNTVYSRTIQGLFSIQDSLNSKENWGGAITEIVGGAGRCQQVGGNYQTFASSDTVAEIGRVWPIVEGTKEYRSKKPEPKKQDKNMHGQFYIKKKQERFPCCPV